jgi:hypothetical protein
MLLTSAMNLRHSVIFFLLAGAAYGHDIITTKVTFDREIVRLFNDHCVSCHSKGGAAFPLTTWQEARPWAKAIGEEVLRRRMPPWGAVKGFGDFRNDRGLTPEQLELVVDWEEGGAPEGEEKDLPPAPKASAPNVLRHSAGEVVVSGEYKLTAPLLLDGLWPKSVPAGASYRITAELPGGVVEPLLWLETFKKEFDHPFLLRTPLQLPAGTVIHGVAPEASVALLRAGSGHPKAPAAAAK